MKKIRADNLRLLLHGRRIKQKDAAIQMQISVTLFRVGKHWWPPANQNYPNSKCTWLYSWICFKDFEICFYV